ncbi:MAG: hypothetical protein JXA99_15895 [Candidatus Lokiarchaeota archaeon]|nr:hypothetical protein [Candidatus Lokiarchaeota archaeon]
MSEIIVPLDYSNLQSVIPKEDEIIYSGISNMMAMNITFYGVHVIISSKNFSYIRQYPNKKLDIYPKIEFNYGKNLKKRGYLQLLPLYEIDSCYFDNGWKLPKITLSKALGFANFAILQCKDYESKEDFKKRKKNFHLKILPYVISSKKEHLNELESHPDDFKSKEINKLKKTIKKWTEALEKEGILI